MAAVGPNGRRNHAGDHGAAAVAVHGDGSGQRGRRREKRRRGTSGSPGSSGRGPRGRRSGRDAGIVPAAARPTREVADAYVASRRPRPNPTHWEGEEEVGKLRAPSAGPGVACIGGGHDNGERRRGSIVGCSRVRVSGCREQGREERRRGGASYLARQQGGPAARSR